MEAIDHSTSSVHYGVCSIGRACFSSQTEGGEALQTVRGI